MPDTQPMRWGVLGAGMIARGVLPCIARAEGCVVTGLAAREPHRARTLLDELQGTEPALEGAMAFGYDEMLHDPTVDAIYVTLPNHLHTLWTVKALRAGKHVLCEKPLCGTRGEAERIRETAREAGLLVAEGFMYMHHPQTDSLVRLASIGDSALGPLRRVHASFCVHQKHEPTIRTRMSHACHGGSIMDLGCYCLSMVRLLAGERALEIESVAMTTGDPVGDETIAVDDDAVVRGRFGDVDFLAESSFREARGVHVTLVGDRATARTGWPWSPQPDRAEIPMTSSDGAPMEPIVIEGGGEKFQLQFEAFARSVRDGGAFVPSMDWSVEQAGMIGYLRRCAGVATFVT